METAQFLYTVPQWVIFAAIIAIVYGWIEEKKVFKFLGLSLFVALGIFAVYAIANGYFAYSEFLSPEEVLSEEMEEDYLAGLPLEAKLLPAYWLFIFSGILAVPALWLEWKNKKLSRLFIILIGLVVLAGFFIIVGAIKA